MKKTQKLKTEKARIKFENGRICSIEQVDLPFDLIKAFLEEKTGLIYGRGEIYPQTIGIMQAWKSCHSPKDELTAEFLCAAKFVIAHGFAEEMGGYVAFVEDDQRELLVYFPDPESPFVIMIEEMFWDVLGGKYNYSKAIKSVDIVTSEVSLSI